MRRERRESQKERKTGKESKGRIWLWLVLGKIHQQAHMWFISRAVRWIIRNKNKWQPDFPSTDISVHARLVICVSFSHRLTLTGERSLILHIISTVDGQCKLAVNVQQRQTGALHWFKYGFTYSKTLGPCSCLWAPRCIFGCKHFNS